MRIAISGHRDLPPATEQLVDHAIRDQLARAVLDAGGQLDVIVPAVHYRDGLPETTQSDYDSLLSSAVNVSRLDYTESTSQAHMAASQTMLDQADRLYAVWDGKPARGCGGTADVVAEA